MELVSLEKVIYNIIRGTREQYPQGIPLHKISRELQRLVWFKEQRVAHLDSIRRVLARLRDADMIYSLKYPGLGHVNFWFIRADPRLTLASGL